MAQHGARMVELKELYKEAQIIYRIGPEDEESDACIHAEEFITNASRNALGALRVIGRIRDSGNPQDDDLLTALKKYVEDTGQSIKEVDNTLKMNGTSLETLLFEIPQKAPSDEMSWRSPIGRRDVIAHRLLNVDNGRVYREAVRDFGQLQQFLSRVSFNPVKTDLASGKGLTWGFRGGALRDLEPSDDGELPSLAQSLVYVAEDSVKGFYAIRLRRSKHDTIMFGSSIVLPAPGNLSLYKIAEPN